MLWRLEVAERAARGSSMLVKALVKECMACLAERRIREALLPA